MHFCTAFVAIGGDEQQVAWRGYYDPVSWPEIEVLRHVHGDDAVRSVVPFVAVEQEPRAEKQRLLEIYGPKVDEEVFTGRKPNMEMEAEGAKLVPDQEWKNPLTGELERTPLRADTADATRAKLSRSAQQRPRDSHGRLLPAELTPEQSPFDAD